MHEPPLDVDALARQVAAGWEPKYLFFWGHTPSRPDVVGGECLSQWYPSPFTLDGVAYATAEHFMMASKARLFGDPTDRIWGIGLAAHDDRARDPSAWNGLNLLGFALMKARAQLASGR